MAGYMTKLNGYVYDGSHLSGEKLANGIFAEIVDGVVKALAEGKGPTMRITEKTALWGLPAIRLRVINEGADEVYFVENEWDYDDSGDYDERNFMLPVGKLVKMRQPARNDEMIMSLEQGVYDALVVGDLVKPAAGGTVAKA